MNARSKSSSSGSERSVAMAGPSRSSIRSASPAFSQYFLATEVHSALMSQHNRLPPSASPLAMQIEEYPVKVPISIEAAAPATWVSNVMRVLCSGAIARLVSFGKRSAVSFASSRRTASGGLLCAVRYALRWRLICSVRRVMGQRYSHDLGAREVVELL